MMVPIYNEREAMRERDTIIFPVQKCWGVVKISLSQWTKTNTVKHSDMKMTKLYFKNIF